LSEPAPSLTVAIPTCNGASFLAETLRSILAQEDAPFDLLICDDRSDDGTVERVRALAGDRARISINAERLGLARNWNRCVDLCRTPQIAIIHQDDILCPGHLAAHVREFASDPSIGLVASGSTVIDEEGRTLRASVVDPGGLGPTDRVFGPGELAGSMAEGNPLRCSAVSMRAEAHRASGGFDPSFRYVVDWDFWLRISRTWNVAWLTAPTVKVRWHGQSETHRFATGRLDLDESRQILDTLFRDDLACGPGQAALRRGANRRLARAFLNRSHEALKNHQPDLARECLGDAVRISPGILGVIARDPRLAIEMATLRLYPGLAGRWFGRKPSQ
jgi:glycosyltransferase involved in cell wall biosynthesis